MIIGQRLDLQKIEEGGQPHQLAPGPAVHNGGKQLAHDAGRAADQVFPALLQLRHGDNGLFIEIFQVRVGDQLVKCDKTRPVFHQNDQMEGALLARALARPQLPQDPIDVLHPLRALLLQHGNEAQKDLRQHPGVV